MTVLISLVLIGGLYLGWHFQAYPSAYFLVGAGAIAAFDVLAIFPYQLWKRDQKLISNLQTRISSNQNKQQLLDDISTLRERLGTMRIEMERHNRNKTFDEAFWSKTVGVVQDGIASKIEQFSSKAEAIAYRHRGNIVRTLNPQVGGFLNPLLVDVCIHDLDYLRQFIHDYSRNKERQT